MILVLVYSYLKGDATLHVEASELIIIFGFLLGFYSGSVMELMDRLRGNYVPANSYIPVVMPATAAPVLQPEAYEAQQATAVSDDTQQEEQEETATDELPVQATAYTPEAVPEQKRSLLNEDNEISEVDIDLKLDLSGLFDEERNQLNRLGFSKAIVTLHNVNGKDIIPAKKVSEDMTTFVASDVKPGIYIARATLSQRLRDDHIINLFGEKTAYITEDKPGLELFVKKYEAAD